MKFSYQWLSELVPGLQKDPGELQSLITIKTAECEGIEPVGTHFASVRVVRVVYAEKIGKGKNQLVRVDVGGGSIEQVVCGASNVAEGMLTAWVPPGTQLGDKLIGTATIDGVESEGMLASGAELELNRDHAGIVVLAGLEPGQSLQDIRPDWIIEIDNKSLTHRPDLWGHIGMAREVAAITGLQLQDPVDLHGLPTGSSSIAVEVRDPGRCPRYSALLLEEAQVLASPLPLQARLQSLGINPINNVVDVTNYILAELPQPMHAFDADKLRGTRIIVRLPTEGETLKALNGETYDLHPQDLVIADEGGPIALAGVIGGADSAITSETTRVLLESANFEPTGVRLTSARHKLRTDASVRFEKSLDPSNTERGLARAVSLLGGLIPNLQVVGGVGEQRVPPHVPPPIALPVQFVERKLGTPIAESRIESILQSLGFGVSFTAESLLTVTVPSWRTTKDISLKDDLVEEVGRMIGYDSIPPRPPTVASVVPPESPMRLYLRKVRGTMAQQGFTEVYNYSFLSEEESARFGIAASEQIEVRNPIASESTHLRSSLLPGIFGNLLSNVRQWPEFRLFEVGNEIHPAQAGAGHQTLPTEIPHLAALMYNQHGDEQDFFELKRVCECVCPGAVLRAVGKPLSFQHPTRTANVSSDGESIGSLFELHPSLLREEGIEGRAYILHLDLQHAGTSAAKVETRYQPLRRYPTSGFDLSVVAPLHEAVAHIEAGLKELAGDFLASLEFVRQYAGSPLPEGQKSVSYHLEIGSRDHTLSADEATDLRQRLIDGMRSRGYELRV